MEEWQAIPGYETLYEASTNGRIRTSKGKTTSNARFKRRVWKQRILKQKCTMNKRGRRDCRVSLWKDGKEKTWLVARLIAITFCDGYSEGMTVNHIDGNPLNNHADNLEWVTRSKNIRLAFENGQYSCQKSYKYNGVNYSSLSKASEAMGRSHGYLSNCLQHGRNPVAKVEASSC